jgi:alpha-mannosidase
VLNFRLRIGNSTISQKVSLAAGAAALEFDTQVHWDEARKMLRVSFPTTIHTNEATYDIQYGCLRRTTHSNTSWDAARFEACGQRYVDLSDNQFGIALLNDCKYGHYIKENVIDLNLLRSPKQPDYWADLGDHHFTYAFMPHAGSLNESAVYGEAAQLNRAPWCFDGLCGTLVAPVAVSGDGISLEVVKRAEKDDRLVLRIVETRGNHTTGTLHLADSLKDAPVAVTDLLEWNEVEKLAVTAGNDCKLTLKPFEILTICIG